MAKQRHMPILPERRSIIRRGTIIRPMSQLGIYWSTSAALDHAAYVVRDDLIFTACHFDQDQNESEFYTEHDEPMPEEVRLYASLALAVGVERGFMVQYPDMFSIRVDDQPCLADETTVKELDLLLRKALSANSPRAMGDPPLPPSSYTHFHWPLPVASQRTIYENVDPTDALLIRGLATLLKSSMLHMHRAFAEEANYPLWISLDASLSIIFEILRADGNLNPNAFDAQTYVHDVFGEPQSGLKYFEEFYQDRITTMHPQNRFGTFAFAPLGHDEFYWLHSGLREVYRYIILGEVVDPQVNFGTENSWANLRAKRQGGEV